MIEEPKVSILLTCYNQAEFVGDCLEAISKLDYRNLELIIVDNGSSDDSVKNIKFWLKSHQLDFPLKLIFRDVSIPYCACFNETFQFVNGKYFIDLAADDFLNPEHIARSVSKLHSTSEAAVVFSDAELVDEKRNKQTFYKRDQNGNLIQKPMDGQLFSQIVAKNYLLSATCVYSSDSFREIGGYDETLAYEDFDFLTRMARHYNFVFSDHIGIRKSLHKNSYSSSQYISRNSQMLPSTYRVCKKIQAMVKNEKEKAALQTRVRYELRHALASANFDVAKDFVKLGEEIGLKGLEFSLYKIWSHLRWDFSKFYQQVKRT